MAISKYMVGEIYDIVILGVYITFVIGIMSLVFGLGFGGFESSAILEKNIFYIGYGVCFLFGLILLKIAGIFYFGEKDYLARSEKV